MCFKGLNDIVFVAWISALQQTYEMSQTRRGSDEWIPQ